MRLTVIQIAGATALLVGSTVSLLAAVYWRDEVMFLTRERGAMWITGPPRVRTDTFIARPDQGPPAVFSKRFTHTGVAGEATIRLKAPGSVEVSLDGEPTLPRSGQERCWKRACRFAVPLTPGDHRLEIRVVNPAGPPLLSMLLAADGLTVATDDTWEVEFPAGQRARAWAADDTRPLPEAQDLRTPASAIMERRGVLLGLFAGSMLLFLVGRRWLPVAGPHVAAAVLALVALFWLLLFAVKYPRIPLLMGFDVEGHLAYVRYVLANASLPLPTEGWSMYHPPLFYIAAAGVVALVDPAVGGDGERWAMRLVPFVSAFGCVCVSFAIARRLFPGDLLRTAVAVLVAGLLPLNLYIAAYVSNEASHAFLASLYLASAVAIMSAREASLARLGCLGLVMGMALLTKFTSVVMVPLVCVVVGLERYVERRSVRSTFAALTVMLAGVVLVAGWFYARNWLRFGDPLMWNLDQPGGATWWQLPGYHTARYFLHFGDVLRHPYFSSFQSFSDGIYSTLWGDGMLAGRVGVRLRNPAWNYDYMSAGYLLSIPAMLIMVLGIVLTVRESFRGPESRRCIFTLFAGLLYVTGLGLLGGALRYPFWSTVKASYALPAIVPLAIASALGFGWVHEWLGRRSVVLLAALYGWAGTLVGVIALAFAA
jgi:hypothetical protein